MRDRRRSRIGDRRVGRFSDLGFDSLSVLEMLLIAEEQLGRELPLDLWRTVDSLAELASWVDAAASAS